LTIVSPGLGLDVVSVPSLLPPVASAGTADADLAVWWELVDAFLAAARDGKFEAD